MGKFPGRLVQVALNRPVWNTYTYRLPLSLDTGKTDGCRVVVPFGRDRLIGYILDNDVPADGIPGEIREVLGRLDRSPMLPAEVMELVRWCWSYYQAPPGMMMAAAHPPGISGRAVRRVTMLVKPETGHPLDGLIEPGRAMEVTALTEGLESGLDIESILGDLQARGEVEITWAPRSGPSRLTEIAVEPTDRKYLTAFAHSIRKRAPKQAEILFHLATMEGPVSRSAVLRAAGASLSSMTPLVRSGQVREFRRAKLRDPLADLDLSETDLPPDLSAAQTEAVKCILADPRGVHLLHGVTGSGKTEVYLSVISDVIRRGGSALVMVPEISLTPLTVSRFGRRFPGQVTVLHSGMSPGERLDSWTMARSGKRRIVIGPRSAVFAPLPGLGVIVVDEEHDGSYKQNELPRYNGRDVAVVRGSRECIPVILGSASPSMESYGNAVSGRYTLIELPDRIDDVPMPRTTLVKAGDMKHPLLSDQLLAGIGKRTAKGEQCIVLINRRGFSPAQACRNCGLNKLCPDCGISLTYHRSGQALRCHYCSYWEPAMVRCPRCGFDEFSHLGPGIQKVQEALEELLPMTRVIRMDSDTTRGRRSHWEILGRFARGEGDVLLGTQMVAKGHDFANVTLVGIIAADMGLCFPDFRAAERTFQLILQVAGRAGRGALEGEVIVQTLDPDNRTVRAAAAHDYGTFWDDESTVRKDFGYPPFGYLLRFVWSGLDREAVPLVARICTEELEGPDVTISPVQEAAFPRIGRRWRWSLLARSTSRSVLADLAGEVRNRMENLTPRRGVRLDIDVDPYNLL